MIKALSEETKKKISLSKIGKNYGLIGPNNSNWKGGRANQGGYIAILIPDHPFSDINERVKEERLVVEAHIGRFLTKKEIIHHKDEIKTNNKIENLQIVSTSGHAKIHGNMKGKFHSAKTKEKMRQAKLGSKHSEETKRKMSLSLSGPNNPLYGKTRSEETRRKIALSHEGKKDTEETKKRKSISAKIAWTKRRKHQNVE